jgi:glycerol-1-phosphate dehydrogenase [NAD(P)+]
LDFHGIQCGTATREILRIYDYIRALTPDKQKALDYAASFSFDEWAEKLTEFIPLGSRGMIAGEAKEHKYDVAKHSARLELILSHWEELKTIMDEELLPIDVVEKVLRVTEAPLSPAELDHPNAETRMTLMASKDIRDKYVASRLLWDLGVLEEAAEVLYP